MMKKLRGRTRLACPAFAGIALVLVSCQRLETPREEPPQVPAAEQERSAACWQRASARADREFARTQPDPGEAFGRTIPMRERFDRLDAGKRRQALYERCMAEEPVEGQP
jgi:hypothetical protein